MQISVMPRRRFVFVLLATGVAIAASILQSAELAMTQIVLYKHGIGYFERQGTVADGEEARLDFKNADMNDILKSLVVTDSSGRHVAGIRYDSNETLEQRLDRFPFQTGRRRISQHVPRSPERRAHRTQVE